jgi:hypothetical protein
MEYYPDINKNEMLSFAAKPMKTEDITASEINQTLKYYMFCLMWKLNKVDLNVHKWLQQRLGRAVGWERVGKRKMDLLIAQNTHVSKHHT